MRLRNTGWLVVELLACALVVGACSADKDRWNAGPAGDGDGDGPGDGDGDGDGDGPPGGFGNSDASVAQWDAGPHIVDMSKPDGGCAATSEEAEQIVVEQVITHEETVEEVQPVALYIVLDQSSSMDLGGLWLPAKEAVKSFVNDPNSAGVDVALEFFPEPGADCTGLGYDTPTVTMGRLPDNAGSLTAELDARAMAGQIGTPIEGALRGGTTYCQSYQTAHPDEKCVVVFVTDGAPFGCVGDAPTLAGIAGAAYAGGSGVRTFAVGLQGADFTLLDEIAKMGGAVDCDEADDTRFSCDVSSGPAQLADALTKIREVVTRVETKTETIQTIEETPLPCEWEIPQPPANEVFDRDKVNVQLTGSKLAATTLGLVDSVDDCAAMGWHYDDAEEPTRIVACAQTCETIQSTPGARVDILLGCATIPLE